MKASKIKKKIELLNKRLFYLKHCFKLYKYCIWNKSCEDVEYGITCFGDMYEDYLIETFEICNRLKQKSL